MAGAFLFASCLQSLRPEDAGASKMPVHQQGLGGGRQSNQWHLNQWRLNQWRLNR